jgi:hypothetical protein
MADHGAIVGDPMRTKGTEVANCFDEIGLALTVTAGKQVGSGSEIDVRHFVVAKVLEAESSNQHGNGLVTGRSTLPDGVPTKLLSKRGNGFHRR